MADVLIEGVPLAAVDRIDSDAAARGLSRQDYPQRRFQAEGAVTALDRRSPAVRGGSVPCGRSCGRRRGWGDHADGVAIRL